MTIVLGISLSHYGSACIIADGEVKAAVLEERLSRRKFDAGFPTLSIRKVIDIAGVRPSEIDHVAVGTMCEQFDSNLAQDHEYRLATILLSHASRVLPLSILEAAWLRKLYRTVFFGYNRWQFYRKHTSFFLDLGISPARIKFYDHHTCHAATAYYGSPWRDKVLFMTCDGNGDGYSSYVGLGQGENLKTELAISSIHSLGGLYSRATRFIGMKPWQDEYKVMGLAPWGEGKKAALEVYREFKKMWQSNGLTYRNTCGYACNSLLAHMNRTLNNPRFDYVAYAVQRVLEEILADWVRQNMAHFNVSKIALSGGIFYNIKANKYIVEQAQPSDLFIFPAAGDESISIGAGYLGYAALQKKQAQAVDIKPIAHYYWGEEIDAEIDKTVKSLDTSTFAIEMVPDMPDRVAGLLADNHIVGVCSSRMEYGPRALGNRSILANPSHVSNVERLNQTIKRRDFWMPFALTIIKDCEDLYLVNPHKISSPYMIMGFDTKPEYRQHIIAGIHQADKTVRPQILERSFNPNFYDLIASFQKKTGIGALLNTSLNMHGEPMVNLPSEAIQLMLDSDLQYLVLGTYLITKKS